MSRLVMLCMVSVCGLAHASGFYLGDNGAKAMSQAGAFAAQADDLTAMQYNPAGLAQQAGWNFLADLQVLRRDVSFLGAAPDVRRVWSSPDPFLLPFLAVSYGFPLAGRTFTIAAGLFSPPGTGRTEFRPPNYGRDASGRYVESPLTQAPERYEVTSTNFFIAYPSLSVAYDFHERFKVGVTGQLTVSRFQQTQTLSLGDLENPDDDAVVSVDLAGQVGFTAILGALWRPTDWLSIGGAFRPPTTFHARGSLSVELPRPGVVSGDQASFSMTLPMELSFGTRLMPLEGAWKDRMAFNIDLVYQGWNSIEQLLISPENVTIDGTPLAPFGQRRNWSPTWSVRVGTSYQLHQYLSLRFGTMYESGAAPTSTYAVDWAQPGRFVFTGGASLHFAPFEFMIGGLFSPTVTTAVADSVIPGGNGSYTSSSWGLLFGVRGHFGEVPRVAKLDDTSAPPVYAPMPANPEKLPVEPTVP